MFNHFLETKVFEERGSYSRTSVPGVAMGLAWTPVGGDVFLSKRQK